MYKLIAIDLDGTMLNTYGEVTETTKRILKETIGKGTEIVIASGRTLDSIKNIAEEVGINGYIIAGNGSIVYDIKNDKKIYEKYIPKTKALNIIKICEENSISYSVYTNKTIISRSLKYNILYYYKENLKKQENKKTSITLTENVYEYVRNIQEDEKVMKIFICDKTKSVFNAILKRINEIEDTETLEVSHMSRKIITNGTQEIPIEYFYTEVTEENVDKWFAIEFLAKKLEINQEEIMAIGDNVNDEKMIENAGMGIAMKGSAPKVIEIADYVTEFDNNHDGVAKAIEKFI